MSDDLKDFFVYRLTYAITRSGMTQAAVAKGSGIHPSAISHYLAGRRTPCICNLKYLALTLGVSTDYLLGLKAEGWWDE